MKIIIFFSRRLSIFDYCSICCVFMENVDCGRVTHSKIKINFDKILFNSYEPVLIPQI